MSKIYYRVASKDAGCERLNIPESKVYLYVGPKFDTEAEAIKAALSYLSTGKFTSVKVVRFITEVVQTYNKEEVQE